MTYNWEILGLESVTSTGLVKLVSYQCDVRYKSFYTRHIGEITVTRSVDDEGYISYDSLTEVNVLGWLDSRINKSSIETSLSESIRQDELNYSSSLQTTLGVPWDE